MRLLRAYETTERLQSGTVATMGNFDGVHLGHQALLHHLRQQALAYNLPSTVIVFEPQPAEYFKAEQAPVRLSSLREKITQLKSLGVDVVYCLKFDKRLSNMKAAEFAQHFIFSLLRVKYLLIGQDFRFGYQREGDVRFLTELAQEKGCKVDTFLDFSLNHERVSSTKVRQALQAGHLSHAKALLGRPYSMCGRVVQGEGRGRQWGIPTANLNLQRHRLPLHGVFCVQVKRENGQLLNGVANAGSRPTVNGQQDVLEIHLFNFTETIYGERLEVIFLHKLRDEVKFNSVEKLVAQIRLDIEAAKKHFERLLPI